MESPQVTTDPASSPQPERQWVWRATLESRAAGKVSVLACVETVFAVAMKKFYRVSEPEAKR